jgi:hypothetical protein
MKRKPLGRFDHAAKYFIIHIGLFLWNARQDSVGQSILPGG